MRNMAVTRFYFFVIFNPFLNGLITFTHPYRRQFTQGRGKLFVGFRIGAYHFAGLQTSIEQLVYNLDIHRCAIGQHIMLTIGQLVSVFR